MGLPQVSHRCGAADVRKRSRAFGERRPGRAWSGQPQLAPVTREPQLLESLLSSDELGLDALVGSEGSDGSLGSLGSDASEELELSEPSLAFATLSVVSAGAA